MLSGTVRLRTDMITRDLLGESFSNHSSNNESHELDHGWPENCLHLIKSGKVHHLQKCSSSIEQSRPASSGSVCTLDKVKSALEREKHDQFIKTKFSMITTSSNSPSSSSIASMTINEVVTLNLEATSTSSKLSVAGCSNCLMYVMISNDNPNCPNCNTLVSLPVVKERHRIELDLDLNL